MVKSRMYLSTLHQAICMYRSTSLAITAVLRAWIQISQHEFGMYVVKLVTLSFMHSFINSMQSANHLFAV